MVKRAMVKREMVRRKAVLGIVAGLGLAMVASACGSSSTAAKSPSSSATTTAAPASSSSSSTTATSAPTHKYTVALVPGDDTDPFYLTMKLEGAAEAKKLGMNFIWEGAAAFSPEAQQPVLAALLARHPSALIVAPTDPNALNGTLKEFHAAGIPIITVDTTSSDTSILTARITSDNAQGGAAAADACATDMHDSGTAAVIYTTPGTTTTNARGQAFIAQMKAKHPTIKVVSEYDNNTESEATTQVSSLILGHPHLKCVFGTNDYAAEGAATAVATSHAQSRVTIAGYDAEPQMVTLLREKKIQIIIAQKPGDEAITAVKDAYDALTGHKSLITASVELPNVLMTPQNISESSISKWIYKG